MGDERLGVKLSLRIDPSLDFSVAHRLHHSDCAKQKIILLLFLLQALVELFLDLLSQRFNEDFPGPSRDLIAHQNPYVVELLPGAIHRQQAADFKIAGRNVKRTRNARPLVQIAQDVPILVAVVHDEQLAALELGVPGFWRFGLRGCNLRCHISPFALRCSPTCKIAPARSLYLSTETASPCLPGFQTPSSSL